MDLSWTCCTCLGKRRKFRGQTSSNQILNDENLSQQSNDTNFSSMSQNSNTAGLNFFEAVGGTEKSKSPKKKIYSTMAAFNFPK